MSNQPIIGDLCRGPLVETKKPPEGGSVMEMNSVFEHFDDVTALALVIYLDLSAVDIRFKAGNLGILLFGLMPRILRHGPRKRLHIAQTSLGRRRKVQNTHHATLTQEPEKKPGTAQ